MRRMTLLFGLFLMLGTAAGAQEPQTTVQSSLYDGFVVTVDVPDADDWQWDLRPYAFGSCIDIQRHDEAAAGKSPSTLSLCIHTMKRDLPFDDFVEQVKADRKNFAMIVLEEGVDDTFGQSTFRYTSANEDCKVGGETVRCTRPTHLYYGTVLEGRVWTWLEFRADADAFEKALPVVEKLARSVRVVPEDGLETPANSQFASASVTSSKRRNHYLENHVEAMLPPGWQAEELELRHATADNERGKLVIAFYTEAPDPFPGEPYQALFVIVEGLEYAPHDAADYLATAGTHLDDFLTERTPQITPGTATLPDQQEGSPDGFCLSKVKTRHSDGSGVLQVSEYEGKNADGRHLKLRIYTGGGVTQACNIIYVADPALYDAEQDQIDAIVKSLEVVTFDPNFR